MSLLSRILFHLLWFSLLIRSRVYYAAFGMEGVNQLLITCPQPFVARLLRLYGASIGKDTVIHSPLLIHNAKCNYSNLAVGNGCHIGRSVLLDLSSPIEIQDKATISMNTCIVTHLDAGSGDLQFHYPRQQNMVRIGKAAYVGAGTTILHGVEIGELAFTAAGAVVRSNVAPKTLVAGVPARIVKRVGEGQ